MQSSPPTSPKSRLLPLLKARRYVKFIPSPLNPDVDIRKQVTEQIAKYFAENPNATVFAGNFDVQGDRAIMKAAVDYGNKNGKAIYVFSVDTAKGQVAHQNYVPKELVKSKKLDAKTWLGEVSKLVGGKVSFSLSVAKHVGSSITIGRRQGR
jgi:alanyl-tRNA synthetase